MATPEEIGAVLKAYGLEEFKRSMDQAQDAINKLAEETEKAGEKSERSSKGFETFQKSAANMIAKVQLFKQGLETFTGVFEKAFEFGKEGGAVIQTEQSFTRLLDTLDLAPNLLNQLRTASAGTITDLKLMSATTTLLAGTSGTLATNLGNATPQLLEIAKAANKLNPTLGDTAFLYESISTGIKRASPMILDNLGLTIKVGQANEDYAKSLGKTVEQLTADEQKQALLNATLAAGKVLIDQAGGAAGSATDSFARMETSISNAGDAIKKSFAPMLADAADAIDNLLTGDVKLTRVLQEHNSVMVTGAKTYEEYVNEMTRSVKVAGFQINANGDLTKTFNTATGAITVMVQKNFLYEKSIYQSTQTTKDMEQALKDTRKAAEVTAAGFDEFASSLGANSLDVTKQFEAIKKAGEDMRSGLLKTSMDIKSNSEWTAKQYDLSKAVSDTEAKIKSLTLQKYRTPEQQKELEDLRLDLVKQKDAIYAAEQAHTKETQTMIFNMLLQKAASDGLTETEYANLIKIGTAWGIVDEKSAATAAALNKIDLNDAHTELAGIYDLLRGIMSQPNNKDITIRTTHITRYYNESGDATSEPPGVQGNGGGANNGRMARGGLFVMPDWVGYEGWNIGPGITASGGERVTVTPRGLSDMMSSSVSAALSPLAMMRSPSNNSYSSQNNYNLQVMTSNSPQAVQHSFAMMKLLAG